MIKLFGYHLSWAQLAWFGHRASGIGVLFYLFMHIVETSMVLFGPDVYNAAVGVFKNLPARIGEIVRANPVVLFMKGTALFPQCGFSSRAVSILEHLGVPFETVDVLQDPEIRQGVKEFSEWPTIPQLYVNGEFVGGSDIMMEMFESGELQQLVGQDAG